MTPIWYMSFADEEGWRGVCMIRAATFEFALTYSHVAGLNPGGEIMYVELGADSVPEEWLNRLLNKDELSELDRQLGGDGELRVMK